MNAMNVAGAHLCRLAAYSGPLIRLDQFLLDPPHNLLVQGGQPRDIRGADLNPAGFGIGWYAPDGATAAYANPFPMWFDVNLPPLARSLFGRLWLAAVRTAALPFTAVTTNSLPCRDTQLIFLHDGFLDDFSKLRRTIRDFLEPHIEAEIGGNSDSEHLFALLRHLLLDDAELSVEEAVVEMFELLGAWLANGRGLLNIVVTEGERIYAARHAVNLECPSLYYTIDDEAFPEAQLVASEPLTKSEFWQPVPPHHLLILDPAEPPELLAL
jgi:glutamine amidotransferase